MRELKDDEFVNLDAWVPAQVQAQYQKDILDRLIKSKREEEKKQDRQQ